MRRTLPEPRPAIRLECPGCGYHWEASKALPGVWWGRGVQPEKIAPMCWCPKCFQTPPIVTVEP
jgi:hypothetical protein